MFSNRVVKLTIITQLFVFIGLAEAKSQISIVTVSDKLLRFFIFGEKVQVVHFDIERINGATVNPKYIKNELIRDASVNVISVETDYYLFKNNDAIYYSLFLKDPEGRIQKIKGKYIVSEGAPHIRKTRSMKVAHEKFSDDPQNFAYFGGFGNSRPDHFNSGNWPHNHYSNGPYTPHFRIPPFHPNHGYHGHGHNGGFGPNFHHTHPPFNHHHDHDCKDFKDDFDGDVFDDKVDGTPVEPAVTPTITTTEVPKIDIRIRKE